MINDVFGVLTLKLTWLQEIIWAFSITVVTQNTVNNSQDKTIQDNYPTGTLQHV